MEAIISVKDVPQLDANRDIRKDYHPCWLTIQLVCILTCQMLYESYIIVLGICVFLYTYVVCGGYLFYFAYIPQVN